MDKNVLELIGTLESGKIDVAFLLSEKLLTVPGLSKRDEALTLFVACRSATDLGIDQKAILYGERAYALVDFIGNSKSDIITKRDLYIDLCEAYYKLFHNNPQNIYSDKLRIYSQSLLTLHKNNTVFDDEGANNNDIKYAQLNLDIIKGTQKVEKFKKGGCFIATASYGSSNADDVIYLSNFRDNFLRNFYFGKLFIKIYYKISPSIAQKIKRHSILKFIMRNAFIKPTITFIKLIKILLNHNY